jgi:hypothetical protein
MTTVSQGTLGTGRLGGPNGLGNLVVPELLGGLRVAAVGFGRIGEEGSVDGHLFPVSVGVRSPETWECQLKRGSETRHPCLWELF